MLLFSLSFFFFLFFIMIGWAENLEEFLKWKVWIVWTTLYSHNYRLLLTNGVIGNAVETVFFKILILFCFQIILMCRWEHITFFQIKKKGKEHVTLHKKTEHSSPPLWGRRDASNVVSTCDVLPTWGATRASRMLARVSQFFFNYSMQIPNCSRQY